MAIVLTVVLTIVVGGLAVALGVYLGKRIRVGQRLGVQELTPAQAAMKRRILRLMGLYTLVLVIVGGITAVLTRSWVAAVFVVIGAMVVLQFIGVAVRAIHRRSPGGSQPESSSAA